MRGARELTMSLSLLTLPEEVLVSVLSCLPPVSLVRVSQVHPFLNQLVKEESIWVERARQDYGIDLKTSEGFSPREFYQAVLYKLGPLLGVWQRTDLKHYSGLVKFSYQNQEVILEAILPPRTVNEDIKKEILLTFKKQKDEGIDLTRGFLYELQPGRISISYENKKILHETQSSLPHQPHSSQPDEGNNQLNLFSRLSEFFTTSTEKMINVGELEGILRIENKGGDACDNFEEFLNEQQDEAFDMELFRRKKEEIFNSNHSCWYKRFEEATHPIASLPSGLFAGDYSVHGVEFINVGLVDDESSPGEQNISLLGRKVTGDPNVPFDKVTFEVDDPRCLNMSLEEQETTGNIGRFMEEPRYIEYQDGLRLPFKVPEDCNDAQYLPPGLNYCRGRWSCKCQVAYDNYQFPSMIPGNLIVFNQDLFAVIFLGLHSMSVYKKVPGL